MTRTLYVGIDHSYICRTIRDVPLLIEQASSECYFYGPGYSSKENSPNSIEEVLSDFNPDLIVTSDFFLIVGKGTVSGKRPSPSLLYSMRRLTAFSFDDGDARIWKESAEYLCRKDYKAKLVVTALEMDWYKFTPSEIDILDCADFIAGYGAQFFESVENLPRLKDEYWARTANDNMRNFMLRRKSSTISLLDFANNNLFSRISHDRRYTDWCVPGIQYSARATALAGIKNSECTYQHRRSLLARVMFYKAMPKRIRAYGLSLYNRSFDYSIQTSRYAYTCGSALRYPVTKMFEIPAASTLLVCESFVNAEDAGFKHEHNYLECQASDIEHIVDWCKRNPCEAEAVARRGYAFVLAKHSQKERVKQLEGCFQYILNNEFNGSEWIHGEYVINSETPKYARPQ